VNILAPNIITLKNIIWQVYTLFSYSYIKLDTSTVLGIFKGFVFRYKI